MYGRDCVQVLDRMGRPEGLAGMMAKRREPVVKSLLTHIPLLMQQLQQRRERGAPGGGGGQPSVGIVIT